MGEGLNRKPDYSGAIAVALGGCFFLAMGILVLVLLPDSLAAALRDDWGMVVALATPAVVVGGPLFWIGFLLCRGGVRRLNGQSTSGGHH
jgi:hypothetical protein